MNTFVQNFQGWNNKPRNSSCSFSKTCAQLPSFFWNSPIYRQEANLWWNVCQCAELDHTFLHLFFVMTFSYKLFPSFHTKNLWCYAWAIYILVRQLQLQWLKKEKKFSSAAFYGWGSTASRLKLLRGGSLFFTTKFPEIPRTHFINLGRMNDWVNLEPPTGFEHGSPGLGIHPVPWPLGHHLLAN